MTRIGTLALLSSLLTTTACLDTVDGHDELDELGESAQAVTTPSRPYAQLTASQLDAYAASARTAGFRPISISAYGAPGAERYAAVFVQRAGSDWKLARGTGTSSFSTTFTTMAAAGYKPTKLSFEGTATNPVWAAVFEKTSGAIPYTRHVLVSDPASPSNSIQYWLKKARDENMIPSTLAIYGSASDPRYAIVLEPNPSRTIWALGRMSWTRDGAWTGVGLADTAADMQALFDARVPAGNRPAITSVTGDGRYAVVYREDAVGTWVTRAELTHAQLVDEIETQEGFGRYPISIEGHGASSTAKFTAIFAQHDQPLAKAFTPIGSGAYRDSAITSVDELFRSFMQANDVRHAGLAVLSGKKLVYARGYNLTEPGTRKVTPTSYFRLASVSKTVTAMEVLKLVDEDPDLDLTDTIQEHLQLTRFDGAMVDPRFATVTIEDLLSHDFPTLAVNGARRCLKRDIATDYWTAQNMGVPLPIPTRQAVGWALQQDDLVREPDDGGSCYSNLGYILLGMLIEQKRDASYLEAIGADLMAPAGITRFRAASPNPHLSDEALYRSANMLVTRNAFSPGGQLVANSYGGELTTPWLATGGLAMAPVDLARLLAAGLSEQTTIFAPNPDHWLSWPVQQMLDNNFGFDQTVGMSLATRWIKGGLLDGAQTGISFDYGGMTYVVMFARNGLSSDAPEHDWYPSWGTLVGLIDVPEVRGRADLFPAFGMPSL